VEHLKLTSTSVKAALMFYIVYSTREDPLMTLGDAIASFLETKDATTQYQSNFAPHPWTNSKAKWREATSKRRRLITIIMCVPVVLAMKTKTDSSPGFWLFCAQLLACLSLGFK
jgi:hypothetical protein